MFGLLILSSIAMLALLVTAALRMSDASKTDTTGAGWWGLVERQSERSRPLSTQARRWQTAFTRSQSDDIRWSELVGYIDELETYVARSVAGGEAGVAPPATHQRPEQFNRKYLRSRIARLESLVGEDAATTPSATRRRNPTTHDRD